MTNKLNGKRINEIIIFLESLKISSKRFSDIIQTKNISIFHNFNQAYCGILTPAVEKQAKDRFDQLNCRGMVWPCDKDSIGSADNVVDNLLALVDCDFLSTVKDGKGKIIEFVSDENFKILI